MATASWSTFEGTLTLVWQELLFIQKLQSTLIVPLEVLRITVATVVLRYIRPIAVQDESGCVHYVNQKNLDTYRLSSRIQMYTARFSLHQVHSSQCTKEYYIKYSWRTLTDVCMVSEVLRIVPRCHVLLQIPLSGLGYALQADSDKVPSIVPYPGVLQWPLAAMQYTRAAAVLR